MKLAVTKTYRQNRARFPAEDLRRYDGQWVAFSADGRRIVASAENIGHLSERVVAAREDLQDVVLERIEVETSDIQLGVYPVSAAVSNSSTRRSDVPNGSSS